MKVKCIGNRGSDLPTDIIPVHGTEQTEFGLEIGSVYTVYGMSIWKHTLNYLILAPDNPHPGFFPAELFEVIQPSLPRNWYFKHYRHHENPWIRSLLALWGYRELIEDEDHY